MLETILAISGKPGLYRLVSRGNRSLIIETLDSQKKRMPVFGTDKVISLSDIAMYTDDEEVPLRQVLKNIQTKQEGQKLDIDIKQATKDQLFDFLGEVLPNFDRDIKKLIQWYNLLIDNGITDFEEALQETPGDNIDDRKGED